MSTVTLPGAPGPFAAAVALSPARARHIGPDRVLQRLHYSQGRTLTQAAMAAEQAWAEARLGLFGRRLSAGVVSGLGVAASDQAVEPGRFVLGAGRAIAPGGQDVVLHQPRSLALADLAPLGTAGGEDTPGRLVALVLEPIAVEAERLPPDAAAMGAFADACPPDATAAPFRDIVVQDAVRVGWVSLDETIAGTDPALAANVAAEAIRLAEAADPTGLPWAAFGVPVALLMLDGDGRIRWVHHAAVQRRGGVLPRAAPSRLDAIRQSRIEGLVEEATIATRLAGWDGSDAARFLRHLPPVGILPRKAWDSGSFFPATWGQAQAPIPISQLDAALESARAMAPYDTRQPRDRVKWLVPVPDALYAPDLLAPPSTPDFAEVRALLETRVADTLALRQAYRAQAQAVQGAIDARAIADFATVEDDPAPGEGDLPVGATPTPEPFDTRAATLLGAIHALAPEGLFTPSQRAMLAPEDLLEATPPFGATPFVETMRALTDAANDAVDFAFSRVQTEIYRVRQIMLDEEEATKLATFPVFAGLAKGSSHYALSEGLRAQFRALTVAVPTADGTVGPSTAGTPAAGNMLMMRSLFDGGLVGIDPASGMTTGLRADRGVFAADPGIATAAEPAVAFRATADTRAAVDTPVMASGTMGLALDGVALVGVGSFAQGLGPSDARILDTAFAGFGDSKATLTFGAAVGTGVRLDGNATEIKSLVDATRGSLIDDALLLDVRAKKTGILKAAPLPGDVRDTRSSTIADRLKVSAALTAKASAVRIKADVIAQIQSLGISLEGVSAQLSSVREVVLLPRRDIEEAIAASGLTSADLAQLGALRSTVEVADDTREWELVTLPAAETIRGAGGIALAPLTRLGAALGRRRAPIDMAMLPSLVVAKLLDPDPAFTPGAPVAADDEAAFLQSAIATLESVVGLLRAVEARISAIMAVVEQVAARIPGLSALEGRWRAALALADQDLDEARHDLRVGLSLIAEETARLAAIEAERARILAEEVAFVAYIRPRALIAHAEGDTLGLMLPGAFVDPLPAALARDVALPAALDAMIEALREMPLGWFTAHADLASAFAKPGYLGDVYGKAGWRAQGKMAAAQRAARFAAPAGTAATPGMKAVAAIVNGYLTLGEGALRTRVGLDQTAYAGASWSDRRRRALADLSLNDLIEARHHPAVARRALDEIESIERVLHAELQLFRRVPAPIRLLWTQSLSVFDGAASLGSLARLPKWGFVAWGLRTELTRLNDWLFGRMEPGVPEARAIMSDLVRVAILLASHAPVAEIVTARIEHEQTVRRGGAVDLVIKRGVPSIGMRVSLMDGTVVRARGVVRDLVGQKARMEVIEIETALDTVTPAFSVALYEPSSLALGGA